MSQHRKPDLSDLRTHMMRNPGKPDFRTKRRVTPPCSGFRQRSSGGRAVPISLLKASRSAPELFPPVDEPFERLLLLSSRDIEHSPRFVLCGRNASSRSLGETERRLETRSSAMLNVRPDDLVMTRAHPVSPVAALAADIG